MLRLAIEKIKSNLLESAAAVCSAALIAGVLWVENRLTPFVSKVAPETVIRLIGILLLAEMWTLVLLWRSWPRLRFDARLKIYFDKKGNPYCRVCFDSKKQRSHLTQEKSGWNCAVCNEFFPKQKAPSTFVKRSTEADPWP